MKTFISILLVSVALLSGIDYITGVVDDTPTKNTQVTTNETAHGEMCIWYPGKILIVQPIIRIHNRIKSNRHH